MEEAEGWRYVGISIRISNRPNRPTKLSPPHEWFRWPSESRWQSAHPHELQEPGVGWCKNLVNNGNLLDINNSDIKVSQSTANFFRSWFKINHSWMISTTYGLLVGRLHWMTWKMMRRSYLSNKSGWITIFHLPPSIWGIILKDSSAKNNLC